MKKILFVLVPVICFGQVNWEIEVIDSIIDPNSDDFIFSTLALDYNQIPHVAYVKFINWTITYASPVDSIWQKEVVDSGFLYYGPSLIFDDNNIAHLSYYRGDATLDMTYHCHAQRDSTGWQIEYIDSTAGSLGNYFWHINSSIDLDTSGLPGIAYFSWNIEDSLHYIKYAHYNGTNWDTSIVEYDSAYANMQTAPTDYSPSLKFSSDNIPYIAFYHVYGLYHADTLKIAYYDDTLSRWIVNPVLCEIDAGIPVCLALNSQDYPCIAHGYGAGLAYTWWDGSSWNTDDGIASIGWLHLRIRLDLDSLDRPHILYSHWGIAYPRYCYKNSYWHLCGPIEPDTLGGWSEADISLVIDDYDKAHVSYKVFEGDTSGLIDAFKYAKGTFVEIEEVRNNMPKTSFALQIFPNPIQNSLNIRYVLPKPGTVTISIYDVTGAKKGSIQHKVRASGWYQEKLDVRNLASGVYFIELKQEEQKLSRKCILVR
jgi:hypothetical protein